MTGRRAACGGFTLVELLVVLAIISLLLAFTPAAFNRMMPGLEVQSATRQLAASLRSARSAAIRDNTETTLTIDLEARLYRLDELGREQAIDEDIEVSMLTARSELEGEQTGRIRFYPDGTSTGGRITFAGGGAAYDVLVDWLTGRIRIMENRENRE